MKTLSDYSLNTHFEMMGLWTVNYKQLDDAVSGILTYKRGEITLKLFGDMSSFHYKKMLYGYTEDGHFIWIPNLDSRPALNQQEGYSVHHFSIQACYIFEDDASSPFGEIELADTFSEIFEHGQNDFKIHDLSFSTNHLLGWLGQTIHHEKIFEKEELCIPYGMVKKRTFELLDDLILQLSINQDVSGNYTSVFVKSGTEVHLEYPAVGREWFQTFYTNALSFVRLIDFLGGRINKFQYIRFEVKPGIRGSYIFEQLNHRTNYSTSEMHTTFKDLEKHFDRLLLNYNAKRNKLDLIIDDYLSEFYLEEFYETKLLNSIRNLEIYHRNFVEPHLNITEDSQQEAARQQIIDFINEAVPEKYQGRFRSQVYYKPEKSLRKRLDYLIKNLPDDIFDTLNIKSGTKRKSRSIGSFINRIVETRHYFTHGDFPENYPNRLKNIEQVKRVNQTLRKICLYYIYKEIGIEDKIIFEEIISK